MCVSEKCKQTCCRETESGFELNKNMKKKNKRETANKRNTFICLKEVLSEIFLLNQKNDWNSHHARKEI
jgi:hypothetical protein